MTDRPTTEDETPEIAEPQTDAGAPEPAAATDRAEAAPRVVFPPAAEARLPVSQSRTEPAQRPEVYVSPAIMDVIAAPPEEARAARAQHDLDEVVHRVLIIGLIASTALMLFGVGLDLVYHRELPQTVPQIDEIFRRVAAFRPSGFLALGLLTLIATPILRVVGSIAAFLYERDWRYAAVTAIVLTIMITSILFGRG